MSDEKYLAQTDSIRKQLAALRAGPKWRQRWRQFRILEWVCASCGETILEVMTTHPWRVVVARSTWADRRGGADSFVPLPYQRPAEGARTLLSTFCRCQQRTLPADLLWDDLGQGRKKRAWGASHDPEWAEALRHR